MKRKLSIITFIIALVLVAAACGQGNEVNQSTESSDPIDSNQNNEQQEETIVSDSNVHPVNLYFSDLDLTEIYSVEVTVTGVGEEVFLRTIEEWIKGPDHEELAPLIPSSVKVQSIEDKDGIAYISFSPELLDANVGSAADAMVTQQIALLMSQFGFKSTQILVDGEIMESLFGHVSTDEPIEPIDAENIKKLN